MSNTEYHYRMKLENLEGTVYSHDMTFMTLEPPIGWVHQDKRDDRIILLNVDFVDINTGTAVGGGSTILRTTDGGTTWNAQDSPLSGEWLYGVDFIDQNNGYAVGDNRRYYVQQMEGRLG